MSDIFSDKYNFIIEEVDRIITGEGCGDAGFDRMVVLSQPGYKRILGLFLFSSINTE